MLNTNNSRLPVPKKIAVLLNGNARSVTPKVASKISRVVPFENIYYSTSLEEGVRHSRAILGQDYDTVFTGGGDGTLVGFLSEMFSADRYPLKPYPAVGVLKLGTGNAVAGELGSHRRVLPDLDRAVRGVGMWATPRPMVTVDGRCTPFAGVGVDAAIINSYAALKRRLEGTAFSWMGNGGLGYFLSIAFDCIPKYVLGGRTEIEMINEGPTAHRLAPDGSIVDSIPQGGLLYAGPATIAAAATVPCYGFGFRAFPFADTAEGRLHVRVYSGGSVEVVCNLRKAWRGEYFSPRFHEFYADRVSLRFRKPQPLQIGGDAGGYRDEVTFGVTPRCVDLIKFLPPDPRPN